MFPPTSSVAPHPARLAGNKGKIKLDGQRDMGAIQVLSNSVGGVSDFGEKTLQRCSIQRYYGYEGCKISRKKALRKTRMTPYSHAARDAK